MKRISGLLHDVQLRHWLRAGEPLARSDGDGLTFTVSGAGHAAWVLRFRHGNRRHELTLGRYPDLSLNKAREEAAVRRVDIIKGVNSAAEKRKARITAAKDWSVRELINDYKAKRLPSLAKSTQVCYARHLKRIEKRFGPLGVREIEAADIVALIENCKLTWGESNLLQVTAKCLFTHACGKRLINVNPCSGIMLSAVLGPRPPVRKRLMLRREELKLLLNARMRLYNALPIRILLATGVRGSELYTARWKDVHLEEGRWHIPPAEGAAIHPARPAQHDEVAHAGSRRSRDKAPPAVSFQYSADLKGDHPAQHLKLPRHPASRRVLRPGFLPVGYHGRSALDSAVGAGASGPRRGPAVLGGLGGW
jgi:hypothetical protein